MSKEMHVSNIIQNGVKEIKISEAEGMEIVDAPKKPSIEEKFKLDRLTLPKVEEKVKEIEQSEDTVMANVTDVIEGRGLCCWQ